MRLPRDLSGSDVVRALRRLGFEVVRQKGSHIRLEKGPLRVTVPNHGAVNVGTLASILSQSEVTIEELTAVL